MAATMALIRRAIEVLQVAVSYMYNSPDKPEKPLLHEDIEGSVRFPVLLIC